MIQETKMIIKILHLSHLEPALKQLQLYNY